MTEMERFLRECVDEEQLEAVVREMYRGSMNRFLDSNDLNKSPEELAEELQWQGKDPCQFLNDMVVEQYRELQELEEEERKEQEWFEELDRLNDIYHRVIEPLRDKAVGYARRHPSVYSVKENVDSTYIRGDGGVIRFSDHPPPVDGYDSEGKPIYRGGWAKDSGSSFYGDYYDAPSYSADPVSTPSLEWDEVLEWLGRIAVEEETTDEETM